MTGTPAALAGLMAECDAHDIRLLLDRDGGLTIDAPQDALTPDLLSRLKANKADVLATLRHATEVAPALPAPTREAQAKPTKPVCRCASTTWRDVPIHDGQSIRRDCRRCGWFMEFPVWYGNDTRHKG